MYLNTVAIAEIRQVLDIPINLEIYALNSQDILVSERAFKEMVSSTPGESLDDMIVHMSDIVYLIEPGEILVSVIKNEDITYYFPLTNQFWTYASSIH